MKKDKWKRYLNDKTDENYAAYKEQRRKVKYTVIQSKQKTWAELGRKLEKDSKGNQKLFFRVLKNRRNKESNSRITIKNEKGEIIEEETEVMKTWKEYFLKFLEQTTEMDEDEGTVEREYVEYRENENITLKELREAIKELLQERTE